VITIVLVVAVLPVLSPTDAGSPVAKVITPENEQSEKTLRNLSNGLTRGRLGALNPGERTGVGGSITTDDSPFQSQDTDPHFTVESPEPAYWRTGSFDTYTGSGWEQSGDETGVDGVSRSRSEISYRVTVEQSASALPTVWQPRSVTLSSVNITYNGVANPPRSVSAGTGYSATSTRPVDDPETLRASGTDYPDAIERQYTGLPSDSPSKVTSFTSDLTADDETPYETARTVEAWLEQNKTYSLTVDDPSGGGVASDFIFEMDKGYCEYFATTMAAMLRSQDIPARYVVGYSTGEQTGENEYTVRGMNAHAWVEVYFADIGWVRFDPTPGRERLQQERQSMADTGEAYSATEQGSPGEEFSVGDSPESETTDDGSDSESETDDGSESESETDDGESDSNEEDTTDDTDSESEGPRYEVSLNRSAVPGSVVAVTVTQNTQIVPGATVLFNGDPIGTTNQSGIAVGTVPFTSQLRVSATLPDLTLSLRDGPRDLSYLPRNTFRQQETSGTTFVVATNATVRVTGETVTNGNVTITATVNDIPIQDAVVYVGSEQVGTTDANGNTSVSLPSEPGNVTIRVQRQIVSGNTTITLPRLSVNSSPTAPVALPGIGYKVNATFGSEPASNATVTINGRGAAMTGSDGIATPSLPFASTATITVSTHGQQATTTVSGLYRNLGGVVVLFGALLAASGYLLWTRDLADTSILELIQQLPSTVVSALVWLSTGSDAAIRQAYRRLIRTIDHIGSLILGQVTPAELVAMFRVWFDSWTDTVGATRSVRPDDPAGQPTETHTEDRLSIREAWARFVGYVSIERYGTRTPGEIAAHAVVEDRLPADAVRTIRDAFRAVEYGQRDAESQLEAVENALERIATAQRRQEGDD
jgi:transglutaminase-like putative cysteine protease